MPSDRAAFKTCAALPPTVPDDTVPDDTVPDATVPDDTVPDATVPDDTVPDALVHFVPDGSVLARPPEGRV